MILLPSQSVNDLRQLTSLGAVLVAASKPSATVSSLTNTPSAIVWS